MYGQNPITNYDLREVDFRSHLRNLCTKFGSRTINLVKYSENSEKSVRNPDRFLFVIVVDRADEQNGSYLLKKDSRFKFLKSQKI